MPRIISPWLILLAASVGSMCLMPIPSHSQSGSAQVTVTATAGKLALPRIRSGRASPFSHPAHAAMRVSSRLRSDS